MYIDENKSRWYTYKPGNTDYTRISRFMIGMYKDCPRCFYLKKRFGLNTPFMELKLNNAVDALLKKEFDHFRELKKPHPLMEEYKLDLIPYDHEDLTTWRGDEKGNYYGFGFEHEPTMFDVCGQIDEIWVDKNETLYIVDFKSTATEEGEEYKLTMEYTYNESYKKQLEVYQWIFRQNGFKVSDTGYIVFANGQTDNDKFDNKLEFKLSIEEVKGNSDWVEPTLFEIKECLDSEEFPHSGAGCEICEYYEKRKGYEK